MYDKIDESFTGTSHASILKPFKKKKDGFGLWQQIVVQYSGEANWEKEAKRDLDMMRTIVWKGNMNLTLSHHAKIYYNCYSNIFEAAEHCNNYNNMNARLANIEADHPSGGYRNNF